MQDIVAKRRGVCEPIRVRVAGDDKLAGREGEQRAARRPAPVGQLAGPQDGRVLGPQAYRP
jgi:hypothetical protein